jgi:hypothetical protein
MLRAYPRFLSHAAVGVAPAGGGSDDDAQLARVLADYLGLYTREALPRWRELFLPEFVAAATDDDGAVTTWNLEAFLARQASVFATGKPIRETMANTHVERTGPLAGVRSDFTWTDGEVVRHGRLMLQLVRAGGTWKILALSFTGLTAPVPGRALTRRRATPSPAAWRIASARPSPASRECATGAHRRWSASPR